MQSMDVNTIYDEVQAKYGSAAQRTDLKCGQEIAAAFGYNMEELQDVPKGANLGLSCGNPHVLANLKEGETVCDLGSGAGFDVFIAAKRVGANGKAIGVDMNEEMLKRANQIKDQTSASNVTFVKSRITNIDLPDEVADCIISNCVINLVPELEKPLVFKEMFRLLKPGGRVAVSDVLAKRELPEQVKNDIALYVGCIAGASQTSDYVRYLHDAGFMDILIVDSKSDLNIFRTGDSTVPCCGREKESSCCGGSMCCSEARCLLQNNPSCASSGNNVRSINFNDFAGSFKIYACKM